jgi:cytochrome c oxidase assembly protein subunit 15
LLIVAGALVTSHNAGLSVPDWPTSFGSLYRMPAMVGGVQYEHGHRMFAELVGLLCIIFAIWTWRVDRRPWMRILGVVVLLAVIGQGILGGVTVLKLLPWEISTAHATLAQMIFGVMVAIGLATSRDWVESTSTEAADSGRPSLRTLTVLGVAAVWIQLILGAAFRHSGMRLLPHIVFAGIVTVLLLWAVVRALPLSARVPALGGPAKAVLIIVVFQLFLGFAAYITRMQWNGGGAPSIGLMVASTVAHVSVGALLLAASLVLAIEVHRHLGAFAATEERTPARQAVSA